MEKFVQEYIILAETKNMVRFGAVVKDGEARRNHDVPYIYLSKKLRQELGRHVLGRKLYAIRLTVEPIDVSLRDLAVEDFDREEHHE